MNLKKLSQIIKKKISEEVNFEKLEIQDKTYLHVNHKGHTKDKFHIKLVIESSELSNMSRLLSTKKIYKILQEELKKNIHSIQIELI